MNSPSAASIIGYFLEYLEDYGTGASNREFTVLVKHRFPNCKWSGRYWHQYRSKIRKGVFDRRISVRLKELVCAKKIPQAKMFASVSLKDRKGEVEQQVAECLAAVTYFVSPKFARALEDLNIEWAKELRATFPDAFDFRSCFYAGSASVFGPVRRKETRAERGLTAQRYHPHLRVVLDLNWFPRDAILFLCEGVRYSPKLWKKSGLGAFELAHILPHKASEASFLAQHCRARPPAPHPVGLFTCVANVALIPKGLAKPTDAGGAVRLAFLNKYFQIYGERHSAGFRGFRLPDEYAWIEQLKWQDACIIEPSDWNARLSRLDDFRRSRIESLLLGKALPMDGGNEAELADDEDTDET